MRGYFYEEASDRADRIWAWTFKNNRTPPHFHSALEFIFCIKGSMSVFIDKTHHVLHEGDICFIPANCVHENKPLGENVIVSLVFAHNLFNDFEKTYPQKTLPHILTQKQKNKQTFAVMERLFDDFVANKFTYDTIPFLYRKKIITDLLCSLASTYELVDIEDKNVENKILQVLTYINQHYKEKLSLEMLAEKFHYSPKYFSDFFNKNTGCSLSTYINNLRVKIVLDELQKRENRESVSTLALENGFGSLATFYRALKKYNSTSDSNIYG